MMKVLCTQLYFKKSFYCSKWNFLNRKHFHEKSVVIPNTQYINFCVLYSIHFYCHITLVKLPHWTLNKPYHPNCTYKL